MARRYLWEFTRAHARGHSHVARLEAGFTLVELLVVSAIFVILSSVVLANHARFGNRIVLQNLAHDIALSIRQAQVYGISVQRFGQDIFDAGYGMYFQLTSPNQYVLFADAVSENGRYDAGETVRSTSISGGFRISDICVTPLAGAETCGIGRLDVLFIRPEPDAYIRVNEASTLYSRARIRIEANSGDTADIIVGATGQIYVE